MQLSRPLCLILSWFGLCAAPYLAIAGPFDIVDGPALIWPVYPYEALLAKKSGVAKLECLVNEQGRLLEVKVLASDGPEFVGATVAYVNAMALFVPKDANKDDQGRVRLPFEMAFDLSKCTGVNRLMSCPSDSAQKILVALRTDPNGKQFSRLNMLDTTVVPVAQPPPIFPVMLQDTHTEGSAMIDFYIDETGRAVLPRVVSATEEAFGFAACQSIGNWRFKRPMRDGKPTVVKVRVPVNFTLRAVGKQ